MSGAPQIVGLILAGGKASRLGHINKGALLLGGRTLFQWVLERQRQQTARQLVSANAYESYYQALSIETVKDLRPGFCGPLAGIEAALSQLPSSTQWLFVTPVDCPFFPDDLANQLLECANRSQARCAYVVNSGKWQPLHCLLSTSLLPELSLYLDRGARSVLGWFETINTVQLPLQAPYPTFANVNTVQELEGLAQHR